MKFCYTIIFFAVFIPAQLKAQRNFKPGYIVTLSGDTTRGYIDYKEWNQNPRDVSFKVAEQSAPQQYLAGSIKAFGVNQLDSYRAYTGLITNGAVDLADLSSGIDSSVVNDNVFLRTITEGKSITLYSYKDKIKTRYFISEKNGEPAELKRYVYLDNTRSDKITEYNFYMQQLLALALKYQPGDSKLADQIQKLPYRANDIEEVILKIEGSENLPKKIKASRAGMRFFAGLNVNAFKTKVFEKDAYLGSAQPSDSFLPGASFGIDVFFNKNVGKWLFRTEVALSANKVNFSTERTIVDYLNVYRRNDQLSFNQLTVALSPQLVYNVYNTDNFKLYMAGGVQINFTKYGSYKHNVQEYLNQNTIGDNQRTKNNLRATYPNGVCKIGVELNNRLDIYANYNTTQILGNYEGKPYNFTVEPYRFGVNYLFGK